MNKDTREALLFFSGMFLFIILVLAFMESSAGQAYQEFSTENPGSIRTWAGIILGLLILFGIKDIILAFFHDLNDYFSPAEKEKRKKVRAERQREEKERVEREQEERERTIEEMKYREREQYRELRTEIEAMPQYKQWREDVLEKYGRKCSICGSTENIEVDHRYHSLHSIIKRYGITNTMQAYECRALWDVNNGAPLCKTCHEKTTSHQYWQQHNS